MELEVLWVELLLVFRPCHVKTGESMSGALRRFEEEMVLQEVQIAIIRESHDVDLLIIAAAFLYIRAKAIQPFLDGNQRSSHVQASILLCLRLQTFPY